MLMPAAVLVLLVLAAIAVDTAIAFLGERELSDITAAAANDAAVGALREEAFYRCGELSIDPERAVAIARTVTSTRGSDAVTVTSLTAQVAAAGAVPTVEVRAAGTVRLIFSPALPGARQVRSVSASSVAEARSLGAGGAATVGDC